MDYIFINHETRCLQFQFEEFSEIFYMHPFIDTAVSWNRNNTRTEKNRLSDNLNSCQRS